MRPDGTHTYTFPGETGVLSTKEWVDENYLDADTVKSEGVVLKGSASISIGFDEDGPEPNAVRLSKGSLEVVDPGAAYGTSYAYDHIKFDGNENDIEYGSTLYFPKDDYSEGTIATRE